MASLLLPGNAVRASPGLAQNDRARQPQVVQTLKSGFKGRRSGKLSASAPATSTDRRQRMLSVTNSTSELVKVAESSTVPVRTACPSLPMSSFLPLPHLDDASMRLTFRCNHAERSRRNSAGTCLSTFLSSSAARKESPAARAMRQARGIWRGSP